MGKDKYHGLNMLKNRDSNFISYGQHENIKTIEIDVSEGEILDLINHIPKVYSLEDESYNKAILLIKLVSKLNEAWCRKMNTELKL
jgi:hypothetical protein